VIGLSFIRKLTKEEVKIIEKIVDFVEDKHTGPGTEGHDYSHILEVVKHSIEIAKRIKDPVDPFILICGALLHDIGRIEGSYEFHAIDGASRAEEFLESQIEDEFIIEKIERVIVRHSPKSMVSPDSPEEKVVYDADAIDRLGYIGMIRGMMSKKGDIEYVVNNRVKKRLADYGKMFYEESRKLSKHLHEQTKTLSNDLRKSLAVRHKDIMEIESYKLILEEEALPKKR
jgi:uncharacterized protein